MVLRTAKIGKGITGLVGLGQEAYAHQQEKKASAAPGAGPSVDSDLPLQQGGNSDLPPTYATAIDNEDYEDDEDDWVADDAQAALDSKERGASPGPTAADDEAASKAKADSFLSRYGRPPSVFVEPGSNPLPAPVLIPQSRPGMRTRGFVRAYAPALADAGVDETAFLAFLKGFDQQIDKQGWFNATNLAVALSVTSYTAAMGPSVIVHFTAMTVHLSIETGRRLYISKKENSYIDEVNEKYFRPRGLYAMIMKYDPNPTPKQDSTTTALEAVTTRNPSTAPEESQSALHNFKGTSGKLSTSTLPQICPLIFPDLAAAPEEKKQNALQRSYAFAQDYYDRRSRAEFAHKNPESQLEYPDANFKGSYADPNTKLANSGLLGALTGGKVNPRQRLSERRARKMESYGRENQPPTYASAPGAPAATTGQASVRQRRGEGGLIKRTLGEKVSYLMVVNLPSEEELQAAKEAVERVKREEPSWWEKFAGGR